mmetsp:Transcript_28921/g.52893  ORF Transcript_28921/g.52893 Transcript_28921/m.52893 type:complete len:130 (+) Transcript_28921:83-472(+)
MDELVIPIGTGHVLKSERVPFGCDVDSHLGVDHDPVNGEIANTARYLFYTRKTAEALAHDEAAQEVVRRWAVDVAKYANDLEFFVRQVGLGLRMGVMVDPPYLPVDSGGSPACPTATRGCKTGCSGAVS